MREMIRLFLVVVVFSTLSGGVLAAVRNWTKEKIEYQQLTFVKGPTIRDILKGCTNDPLVDRFKIPDGDKEINVFLGRFEGQPSAVALEAYGQGFGGPIGVMVAINLETDQIVGIGVTTHSETPGVGSRAKTDRGFGGQFKGLSMGEPFKIKTDGGPIDSISGATVSSRGVCEAVNAVAAIYLRLKEEILGKVKA